MGQLEDEVRELILAHSRSIASFAREIGIPKNTLYSALRNGFAGSTLATIKPIIETLDLDITEFMEGRATAVDRRRTSVLVPLYGSISAGKPIEQTEAEGTFPIPAELHDKYPDAFMLKVKGSSMDRVLPNGHYALIKPCKTVDSSGRPYAVIVGDNAATIKHVRILANGLELLPDSHDPTHHPMVFDHADSSAPEVRVVGYVVWHCPPINEAANGQKPAALSQ